MANIRPEAARYIGERILLARKNNNPDLVDALLDLWIDHRKMADDSDAVEWGINPKLWAAPSDLKSFYRMPHPSMSRLRQ